MVLSTQAKEVESNFKSKKGTDFWDQIEAHIGLRMKDMTLEELLNLLWSTLEIGRGGQSFLEQLESNLMQKLLKVKDDELNILLACLEKTDDDSFKFNQRFI